MACYPRPASIHAAISRLRGTATGQTATVQLHRVGTTYWTSERVFRWGPSHSSVRPSRELPDGSASVVPAFTPGRQNAMSAKSRRREPGRGTFAKAVRRTWVGRDGFRWYPGGCGRIRGLCCTRGAAKTARLGLGGIRQGLRHGSDCVAPSPPRICQALV